MRTFVTDRLTDGQTDGAGFKGPTGPIFKYVHWQLATSCGLYLYSFALALSRALFRGFHRGSYSFRDIQSASGDFRSFRDIQKISKAFHRVS